MDTNDFKMNWTGFSSDSWNDLALSDEKYLETKNWPKADVDCKLICQMKH